MAQPKVLMLGWEFPPIINGGLGVASMGIARALSSKSALTLILPKADPKLTLQNTELVGLNQLDLKKYREEELYRDYFESIEEVMQVPVSMDPYHSELQYRNTVLAHRRQAKNHYLVPEGEDENPFEADDDLYGHRVVEKVRLYAKYACQIAEEREFDVIHAHDWMTFPAALEIKLRTGTPIVLHVHSLDYDRGGADLKNWIFHLEKELLQEADQVVAVSHYTAGIMETHYGVDPEKITVVYNGVTPRETYSKPKGFPEKLVLFLGRVTGQKGPENFLEVAQRVYRRFPEVRFVMAGTGDRLKRMIEAGAYTEVGHRFHFTGFLDQQGVGDLLAMSDVYCMPSVSEPFGLSALEAAQFGVPMVISRQSGVSEVLPGALVADHWDTDDMAQQVLDLLTNEPMARLLAEQNTDALHKLSWDAAADKLLALYSSLNSAVAE